MLFELRNVSLQLGGKPVLDDVGFSVGEGERVVLLGVNGCGKTTLLRLLDALVFPTAGQLCYRGAPLDPRRLDDPAFRRAFRGEVALLFQNVDAMLFNPTVADEIAFGPRQLGLRDVEARVARWAEVFALSELLHRPPFDLSGGEKKRVALAAILAVEPKVLLLDEATAGLDPATAARLVDLIDGLAGVTVISSTHNLTIVEELGDRAILVGPGRRGVMFDGPPGELLARQPLLVESGLAHRHVHKHEARVHAHYHVHDLE